MKKVDLAQFYFDLLEIAVDSPFRLKHQALYAAVRDALALELNEDAETVQNVFEKLASK